MNLDTEEMDRTKNTVTTKIAMLPAEIIVEIASKARPRAFFALRLVCRTWKSVLEDTFLRTFIGQRSHYFAPNSLHRLLNIAEIPRFAKAIRHLRLTWTDEEDWDSRVTTRDILREALSRVAEAGGRLALSFTDRATPSQKGYFMATESAAVDGRCYWLLANSVLMAIDFPGTPVHSLNLGLSNLEGLRPADGGLGPHRGSDCEAEDVSCKSLTRLRCLKFSFEENQERHLKHGDALGDCDLDAILSEAVNLRELSVARAQGNTLATLVGNGHVLNGIRSRVSHLKLRKLQFLRLAVKDEILDFVTTFRDSLTHLDLVALATPDPHAWPRLLRTLAEFPALKHVSLEALVYACPEEHRRPYNLGHGPQMYYLCKSAFALVEIEADIPTRLLNLAAEIEDGASKTYAFQDGADELVIRQTFFIEWHDSYIKRKPQTYALDLLEEDN